MGWARGYNAAGREIGYAVDAECDQDGCAAQIDRGVAYACGGMHDGGDYGCGSYFCGEHLLVACGLGQLCSTCSDLFDDDEDVEGGDE